MQISVIVGLVLAAGRSLRMGRPKQTLQIRGKPMLQIVVETLRESKVDRVVVVLGAGADEVRRKVKFEGEGVIVNRGYRSGMSGSLRLGLTSLGPGVDAAIVYLADQPFVSPHTIDRMLEAYLASRPLVVVPVYHGKRGNPVLLDRALFPEIMTLRGDVGAKSVVNRHEDQLLELEVGDRGVLLDIDTPSDLFDSGSVLPPGRSKGR